MEDLGLLLFFFFPLAIFLLSIFLRNNFLSFVGGTLFLILGIGLVTGTISSYALLEDVGLEFSRMVGVCFLGFGMYVTIMSGLNFIEE